MPTRNIDRNRVVTRFEGESLTRQSEAAKSDINNIVKRGIPMPDPSRMMYGDFTDGLDYQTVQNRIIAVNTAFDALPSQVRDYFKNNPAKMLDFVTDPANVEAAVDMGLLPKSKIPVTPVLDINPEPPNPKPGPPNPKPGPPTPKTEG
ncbi:MAG: internal scaffolding protein [Microviridae sp.]|nr:MAG: internal scaffolding protein [Microviridae sp.]